MKSRMQPGLVAVVTGASTGIGKDMAILLSRRYKAKLVLNARGEKQLQAVAQAVEQAGGQARTVCGDIGSSEVQQAVVGTANEAFGHIDMLVNNAGFARPGAMADISAKDWRDVFEVNLFAPVQLVYSVLPQFLERRSGIIVNIASVAGKLAFPGSVCYSASKFALTGFSEGMAAELAREGIDVITVCPGLVRTEFFRKNNNPQDPTAMAEESSLQGFVMKHLLSISSQQAAREIVDACRCGGPREIVLTGAGRLMERVAGICPPAAWWIAEKVPARRGK